jgi:hypothetical protein
MKQPSKEDTLKKWGPILDSMGMTGSKSDWMSQYANAHLDNETQRNNKIEQILESNTDAEFPTLLPIAMKIASKTISNDLIFASKEEIDEVKKKVQSENRDGKIEAIIEGGEFIEKKLEDDQEYKELMKKGVTPMSGPSGTLFYLDFKYDNKVVCFKKTRRAGKKHKKKNGSI